MPGRIIQLTPARRIVEPPFIDTSIRADIGDYGPPGWHLHGPLAQKGRSKASALGIPGAADGDGADGGFDACAIAGGLSIHTQEVVAAATVAVFPSLVIASPFIITHVGMVSNKAVTDNGNFRIYISDDRDTTGGVNTTGTNIGALGQALSRFNHSTVWSDVYPGFIVRENNKVVKVIIDNDSAASQTVRIDVDLQLLQ